MVDFPLPEGDLLTAAMQEYLRDEPVPLATVTLLANAYRGTSYSDIEREVMRARRMAAVQGVPLEDALLSVTRTRFRDLPVSERVRLASDLMRATGASQRRVHDLTGVSRDTLRKYTVDKGNDTTEELAHA